MAPVHRRPVLSIAVALGLLWVTGGHAQTLYHSVSELLPFGSFGRATAIGDYDNDGWPDLLASGTDGRLRLSHNEHGIWFSDAGHRMAQVQFPETRSGGGTIFGDYDNDGDLDVFAPIGSYNGNPSLNVLLRNDRGVFTDVTLSAGLTDVHTSDNAIWLDYDLDGHLDLYVGNGAFRVEDPSTRNLLYHNNGDGTFRDATVEAGLDVQFHPTAGGSNGSMLAGDFDGDGSPDLYVGVFREANRLFLNDGAGAFRDATSGEIGGEFAEAFGATAGDIDNDGYLDVLHAAAGDLGGRSQLLLNLGQGDFLDVLEGVGLGALRADSPLAVGLADVDNDGDLDLMTDRPHYLFLNDGRGIFVEATDTSGVPGGHLAVSFGDIDLDGFVDVLFGGSPRGLYRNHGNQRRHLRVELAGVRSNRNGIGARVTATAGDLRQTRQILGGYGFYQDELVAHFGLGDRTQVDTLTIHWPSGEIDVLTAIPADQKIRVIEGRETYHAVQPTTWESLSPDTLMARVVDLRATIRPALFEAEATITAVTADLSNLGGPVAVPLIGVGDGTYRLQTTIAVSRPSGLRPISILIHQATSLGPYWTRLSRDIAVYPQNDLGILDEGSAEGWQVEGVGGAELADLMHAGTAYRGDVAGAFQVTAEKPSWDLRFLADPPVDELGFAGLHFAFHPGDAEAKGELARLSVSIDARVDLLRQNKAVDLSVRDWQVVTIPLQLLHPKGKKIESIVFRGNLEGTFYLDDIRLVTVISLPVATAVVEGQDTTLPSAFTLANYPNPFNPETTIRFDLPRSAEIELAVYNLAAQKVATLVQGHRETGSYSVRWDGRDDAGRELASGVYVYRLTAGNRVETRKLLLLR